MKKNKEYLLSIFESGDKPTGQDFEDLINSTYNNEEIISSVGLTPEMLERTQSMTDRQFLQQAIDYAEANNIKLTLRQNHTYNLDGSLYFTKLNLDGNMAKLKQNSSDTPILMSRILHDKSGGIGGESYIRNLVFEGNIDNPSNHGLYVCTYWSRFENLEFVYVGGSAVFLTTSHRDGTLLTGATLVENIFKDIIVRNSGGTALLLGDGDGNNKITDGIIENAIICTSGDACISIASGAGWSIRGVHTYAGYQGFSDTAIHVANCFNTTITDIYIEGYLNNAFVFNALQRNLAVTNVNITSSFGYDGHSVFYIDRQGILSVEEVGLLINNLNIVHENEDVEATAFKMLNGVMVDVNGYIVSGDNKDKVEFSTDTNPSQRFRYMLNSSVSGSLKDNKNELSLFYNGYQLKQVSYDKTWSNQSNTSESIFVLPPIPSYSKLLIDLSVHGSLWGTGAKVCTWKSQVYLSLGESNYGLYVSDVIAPNGFSSAPVVEITADKKIKVTFTPISECDSIIVAEYVVCL